MARMCLGLECHALIRQSALSCSEISLYSLVAFSAEKKLVGFAAFDDNPMAILPPGFPPESADKAGRWAVQSALDLGYRREMLLWLTVCGNVLASREDEEVLLKAILSSVLVLSTDTMVILQTSAFEFGCIPSFLKPLAHYQKQDFKLSICACRRRYIFPKLTMRRAREEDQDDLTPVIEHAQQRGLPFTQVPQSACPSKPYAVARLIAAQNKLESVFVAEVRNKIMGVVALTADVHLPSLHENYDLDCFEGLASKTVERKLTVIPKKEEDPFFVDPFASATTGTEAETAAEEPAVPLVEFLVRWPENVLRITMLCMEEEYESRAIDMIDFAFSKLNKEFCLVTLPYDSPDHPLLHFFYRVPARLNVCNKDQELSAETRCLYLLHVDALSPGFAVRPFKPVDRFSLGELLDNFEDKKRILNNASRPAEGRMNMVALLSNHVVGFAMLDDSAPVEEIASHFDLQSLLHLQHHPFRNHTSIVLLVLNPVYRCRSRLFLQEIMRQTGKSVIYCPVFPSQELPDMLEDLILVSGRQHAHMAPACYWGTAPPEGDENEDVSAESYPKKSDSIEGALPEETVTTKGVSLEDVLGKDPKTPDISFDDGPNKSVNSQPDDMKSIPHDNVTTQTFSADVGIINRETDEPCDEYGLETDATVEAGAGKGVSENDPEKEDNPIEGDPNGSASVEAKEKNKISYQKRKTHFVSGTVATKQQVESGARGTKDEVGPGKTAESAEETHEMLTVVDTRNNAEPGDQQTQGVSAKGGPEINQNVEVEDRKSVLGVDQIKDDISIAGKEIVAEVKNDQRNTTYSGANSGSAAKSPKIESDVPPARPALRRGYYHGFDCALYALSRKYLYRYRTVIKARIVVAGSSITTAGFLHQLLASHELQFTNLIMVSDVGFKRLSCTSLSSLIADLGPKHAFPKLGLDCQVKVIMAVVIGINRKDRTVQLSSGEDLPFDWLILSSGLQEQTRQSLGAPASDDLRGVLRADELVLRSHNIAKSIAASSGQGKTMAPVVVYGATIEAYGAVQALLQEGIEGKNVLLIHPETVNIETAAARYLGDKETSEIILATLRQAGLSIHSGMKLVGLEMNANNDWISGLEFKDLVKEEELDGMSLVPTSLEELASEALKPLEELEELLDASRCPIHRIPMGNKDEAFSNDPHAHIALVRPERKLKQPCSLLVTCDRRQVDLSLFRALHKEALIFDGRIVVDGYFQTNDPLIFATGSLCKFSRHCGDSLPNVESFCPWEVGEAMASAFKAVVVTSIYGARTRSASQEDIKILKPHMWPRPNLPSLKKARCIAAFLPGDQWFLSATAPKFCTPLAGEPARTLMTQTSTAYCRLDIMDNKEVGRIIYFGKDRLQEWKIVCFVGLPETLLNNLVERWESKEVKDIRDFLLRPWADIIFHDRFTSFFQDLSDGVKEIMRKSRKSMTVFVAELEEGRIKSLEPQLMKQSGDMIHQNVMRFLEDNKYDLPKYDLPGTLNMVGSERITPQTSAKAY